MKKTKSYNVQIWIGLREQYTDVMHNIDCVRKICDNYVNIRKDGITITPTEFRYVNGNEPGVIIGFINYPRFPRTKKEIRKRAFILAEKLMVKLNQFRVSVTTPNKTYMLENKFKII